MFVKGRAQHGASDTFCTFAGTSLSCPGNKGIHHPWKCLKRVWMWRLGIWFGGEHGSAGLDLINLGGVFHPEWFSDSWQKRFWWGKMWNEVSAPGAEQECRGQSTEQDVRMLWECSCIPPGFHFREDLGFKCCFCRCKYSVRGQKLPFQRGCSRALIPPCAPNKPQG